MVMVSIDGVHARALAAGLGRFDNDGIPCIKWKPQWRVPFTNGAPNCGVKKCVVSEGDFGTIILKQDGVRYVGIDSRVIYRRIYLGYNDFSVTTYHPSQHQPHQRISCHTDGAAFQYLIDGLQRNVLAC